MRLIRSLPVLVAASLATAGVARAGDLSVEVRTPKGAPVADAVVTVAPASGGVLPARFGQALTLAQRNKMFDPFVLVVPVGATVAFPNQDAVRHQVYSFSPAKKFELKLYGREQSRTITFDKAGVVAVGCNIHDQMTAFIKVVDTPFAAKTDAAGRAEVRGVPAGPATVRVWQPYMKAPGGEQSFRLAFPASGAIAQAVVADVRTPPMAMGGY